MEMVFWLPAYASGYAIDLAQEGRIMGKRSLLGTWGLLTAASLMVHDASASDYQYRLGAQDKLRVHVQEWPALAGEFTIGAEGAVSLPLVGEIPASGLRTSELAT